MKIPGLPGVRLPPRSSGFPPSPGLSSFFVSRISEGFLFSSSLPVVGFEIWVEETEMKQ